MKTTLFRNLLTAVACLLAGVTAQAQFTAEVNQVPRNDWAPEAATFSAEEVATALGTDAATLLGALTTWMAEASSETNMFFYAPPSAPDTWSDAYTTGGEKGFWLDADGEIISYPDGAYYANPVFDTDAATFSINIGMMPDQLKYGIYEKTLHFCLQYNGKTATFTIDFKVTGDEKIDIPEPATLKEDELNIVGEQVVTVEQYPRSDYTASPVYVNLAGIVEKLGLPSGFILEKGMSDILFTTEFDSETVNKKETLTNTFTADPKPGFWYTDIRVNGDATGECSSTTYGGGCFFYMADFAYSADSDTLSCVLGQYPDKLNGDEEYFANVYLIYADKAYRIRYDFKLLTHELGNGLEDYTKVGEETVELEQVYTGNWGSVAVRPDLDAITAALGCTLEDLQFTALDINNSFATSTANNGGFWFSADGYVVGYNNSESAVYVEPATTGDFSQLNVGQHKDKAQIGDEYVANCYFIGGNNYYAYTVKLKVVEPTVIDGSFQSVAQRSYTLQQLPDNNYGWCDGVAIPYDFIEETLGTSSWVVYGLNSLDDEGNEREGNDRYTKNYTITETPGFWLNAEGRNNGWNASAIFGISAGSAPGNNGKFSLIQFPERCHVGDVLKTQLFYVNESTSKMITFNFTYNIVESIVEYENVGSENVTLPVSFDEASTTIDMSKAAEALGVSVDELLDERNTYLHGMTSGGTYGMGVNCADGLVLDKEGFFNVEQGLIVLSFFKDGDTVTASAYSEEELPDDFTLSTQFCFQVEEKQYEFFVKFVSAAAFNGITDISTANNNDGQIYDLSGRRVMKPVKGLYIMNGKKVLK